MIKVVIDTNLLIDGSEDFFNFANRIIDLVIAGQIEAYANHQTLRENMFLAEKKITDEGYLKKLKFFFAAVHPVETKITTTVAGDEEDEKILASAEVAGADFLITSDKHLLQMDRVGHTQIVRPNEFWSRYEEEGEQGWMRWIKDFIQ